MKNKLVGIFVCMLLIAAVVLPAAGTMKIIKTEMVNTGINQDLNVTIINPKNGLYFMDKQIIPLKGAIIGDCGTFIIGDCGIETEVDSPIEIGMVKFYIDDELLGTDDKEPYEFQWNERVFFFHTIKVEAIDINQNTASDEVKVFIFNFNFLNN